MVAGVLFGPLLFGLIWLEAQAWLFPWDKAQATLMASPIFDRLVGSGENQPEPETGSSAKLETAH